MSTDPSRSDIPREPSAYRVTLHFKQRFEDAQSEFRRHLDVAIDSGRWIRPQLEDIQEFLNAKPEHTRR